MYARRASGPDDPSCGVGLLTLLADQGFDLALHLGGADPVESPSSRGEQRCGHRDRQDRDRYGYAGRIESRNRSWARCFNVVLIGVDPNLQVVTNFDWILRAERRGAHAAVDLPPRLHHRGAGLRVGKLPTDVGDRRGDDVTFLRLLDVAAGVRLIDC